MKPTRVKTFCAKTTHQTLKHLDEAISNWLQEKDIEVKMVCQVFGYCVGAAAAKEEPTLFVTIWY